MAACEARAKKSTLSSPLRASERELASEEVASLFLPLRSERASAHVSERAEKVKSAFTFSSLEKVVSSRFDIEADTQFEWSASEEKLPLFLFSFTLFLKKTRIKNKK